MGYLTSITPEDRFFQKVDRVGGGYPDFEDPLVRLEPGCPPCWIWTGTYNANGYPRYNLKSLSLGTIPYRIAWQILVGPISPGAHLDHLCRRPGCVNPDHLEPVTPKENALRSGNPAARNARKTRCSRGHLFTAENTLLDAKGHRRCRVCSRKTNTNWARKKRAKLKEEKQNGNS